MPRAGRRPVHPLGRMQALLRIESHPVLPGGPTMNPDVIPVPVFQLPHGQGLPLPSRATPHSAGMDLRAAIAEGECWVIEPGRWRLLPTGLVLAIPEGCEAQVRPRSGLALKHGVTVLNAPGTIDADYRNEVMVVLINHGQEPF